MVDKVTKTPNDDVPSLKGLLNPKTGTYSWDRGN